MAGILQVYALFVAFEELFLISNFRRVLNVLCFLLGVSAAWKHKTFWRVTRCLHLLSYLEAINLLNRDCMGCHFFNCRMKRENVAFSHCRRVGKLAKSDAMSVYLRVRPPLLLFLSLSVAVSSCGKIRIPLDRICEVHLKVSHCNMATKFKFDYNWTSIAYTLVETLENLWQYVSDSFLCWEIFQPSLSKNRKIFHINY
jgi:hypothetical protein